MPPVVGCQSGANAMSATRGSGKEPSSQGPGSPCLLWTLLSHRTSGPMDLGESESALGRLRRADPRVFLTLCCTMTVLPALSRPACDRKGKCSIVWCSKGVAFLTFGLNRKARELDEEVQAAVDNSAHHSRSALRRTAEGICC